MFNNIKYLVNVDRVKNWNLMAEEKLKKEPVVSFISSWISLNHLYATLACINKEYVSVALKIKKNRPIGDQLQLMFFASQAETNAILDELKSSGKIYEIKLPIKNMLSGKNVPNKVKQSVNILDLEPKELFSVVYQVRNNLFHGSKDPRKSKRDEILCSVLAELLFDFNKMVAVRYL